MKPKSKLSRLIPNMRWVPHDIPSAEPSSSKPKSRNPFSLKSSSSSSPSAPPTHPIVPRARKPTLKPTPHNIDAELDTRTHAQAQSPFFAQLPLELRRMVYEYVVGIETIHLTLSAKKRFGHFICESTASASEDDNEQQECTCRVLVGGRKGVRFANGGVGMVRVCKRMSQESTPHLYTPHTFALLHITHLLYLPTALSPRHTPKITKLHLRWAIRALPYLRRGPSNRIAYREDTRNWERAWDIIAGLSGLRELVVVLLDPSPGQIWERGWAEVEDLLMQGVGKVRGVRSAQVFLPYASCGVGWELGGGCVRLRRPEGDGSGVEEDEDEEGGD
ncbi:hypothetical protein BDW02DRAFT_547914 [Decorospora gaudefroyi]|uniref:DUF7730 domain-containing protein n=1 Tax=Decorospora gaudefroyi TaxID=184978 RepID=A0A6A5KI22_9PLEO|nr:hypothetical protein BDW02DRAFT_547914 [Decorospora gaudefroyi]